MDEYPDEDEEFELMYGDELDALKDLENENPSKPNKTKPPSPQKPQNDQFEINNINNTPNIPKKPSPVAKKRTVQEIFTEYDELFNENSSKKHKLDDLELIEHIVEMRKLNKEKSLPQSNTIYTSNRLENRDRNNYSRNVPNYPFIKLRRSDGTEYYVRFHSEQYEKDETKRLISEITAQTNFEKPNLKITEEEENEKEEIEPEIEITTEKPSQSGLWVELYKPKRYVELLSDESTNRVLLKWLKLWDKCVFHRQPKIKKIIGNKFDKEIALNTDLDEYGRPFNKVALLAGPPGIGKTTLAHLAARHLGYNIVELNASDDRSLDAFKTALDKATQMQSVLDTNRRPNCMIFDEIDGAPAASINYLVKYILDTRPKAKSAKKSTKPNQNVLKRPIICICNDLYVAALRPLRQIAFVINFPAISNMRLAERLMEIARKEQIKTDLGVLVELAKKSNSDIRSCLTVLQFFKSRKKILLSNVHETTVGEKDTKSSLFTAMDQLFFIKNGKDENFSAKNRMGKVLRAGQSFGDYERLAQGVFENYPELMFKNSDLKNTCFALDWFCLNDRVLKQIYSVQDYQLFGYLQYALVAWHFVFATRQWKKLKLPEDDIQMRKKRNRHKDIIQELVGGLKPAIRTFIQANNFILDVLPFLKWIIIPNFRPINLHLHTQEEKDSLDMVVNIMIDYNLNYVQERLPDGTYTYKLDPNIVEVVNFGNDPSLSYSNKQIIAQQLQTKRIHKESDIVHKERSLKNEKEKIESMKTNKDFFGRAIIPSACSSALLQSGNSGKFKGDIWFQYKEGYSNAVKKTIKISSLK